MFKIVVFQEMIQKVYLFISINMLRLVGVLSEKEIIISYNDVYDKSKKQVIKGVTEPEVFGFLHAFIASFSMIMVSEIGDKTFFIAAIMSMKHSRMTVFLGAIAALILMTILSVVFGWAVTVIPRMYTLYISAVLFTFFGIKMLREGIKMSSTEAQEEIEQVQLDISTREELYENDVMLDDIEIGIKKRRTDCVLLFASRIILQAFSLTFLAEWGDRSQIATIILAAREDLFGVTIGSIIGHVICTGLAVLGGRFIAQKISVRTVTIIGGTVFLVFAFSSLIADPKISS